MPKFFFDPKNKDGNFIFLYSDSAHHIVNVLRTKLNVQVFLCDGNGNDYATRLCSYEFSKKKKQAKFEVLSISKSTEPVKQVRLYMSAINWQCFEAAIQKSVEVGVLEVVPIVTKRAIYSLSAVANKLERLNRVAKSAAEQSHRGIIPKVLPPMMFEEALLEKNETCYVTCCEKECIPLSKTEIVEGKIGIWVGPEGGFTKCEIGQLEAKQAVFFSLGKRILRSETAAAVAVCCLTMED